MSSISRQPDKIGYSIKEAIAATSLGRSTLYRYIGEGRSAWFASAAARSFLPTPCTR